MKYKFKKLLSYYKPYKKIFIFDLFFSITQSASVLAIPLIVRYITNTVILMSKKEAVNLILFLGVGILFLLLIQFGCNYFTLYYGHIMGAKIEKDMRSEIFTHYQKLPFSFYDNRSVGELLSRVTLDLNNISEFLHHIPEEILNAIIRLIGVIIILFSINWKGALVFIAIFPLMIFFIWIFVGKTQKAFLENHEKIAEINSQIEENLSGIRTVKAFANQDLEMKKFEVKNSDFVTSKKKSLKIMGLTYSGITFFITSFLPVIVIAGLLLNKYGQLSIQELLTFILCENILINPIFTLVNLLEQSHDTIAGYKRFLEILKIKTEPETENYESTVSTTKLRGSIEFIDVSFKYPNTNNKVLSNLNFKIEAGKYVAIVGQSGSGKSTICNLIPRFYDILSGKILINNTNIKNIRLDDLRKNIGFIQQNTVLFSGTVAENILYGNSTANQKEIMEAAKKAYAHEFIMNLPDKYETKIGWLGTKLSGGQKQRIAIARIFLKNPPILIFDEATSNLDNESEKYIQKSIELLSQNRTIIVISHHLSKIKNAEKIFVLSKNGNILEEGTHEELIKLNGLYAELYKL